MNIGHNTSSKQKGSKVKSWVFARNTDLNILRDVTVKIRQLPLSWSEHIIIFSRSVGFPYLDILIRKWWRWNIGHRVAFLECRVWDWRFFQPQNNLHTPCETNCRKRIFRLERLLKTRPMNYDAHFSRFHSLNSAKSHSHTHRGTNRLDRKINFRPRRDYWKRVLLTHEW